MLFLKNLTSDMGSNTPSETWFKRKEKAIPIYFLTWAWNYSAEFDGLHVDFVYVL